MTRISLHLVELCKREGNERYYTQDKGTRRSRLGARGGRVQPWRSTTHERRERRECNQRAEDMAARRDTAGCLAS